ncbi:MAG: hypothetical protein ABW196_07255 [Solirubrobacterales bacterium]
MRFLRELLIAVLAVYLVRWLDSSAPALGAEIAENAVAVVVLAFLAGWGVTFAYLAYGGEDRLIAKRCPFRSYGGRLLWAVWIFVFYLSGFVVNSGMSSMYDPRTTTRREIKRSVRLAWENLALAPAPSA